MKVEKHINIWRLNNIVLYNEWVNNEIKSGEGREGIKRYLKTNDNKKHNDSTFMGHKKSNSKKELHSKTEAYLKMEKAKQAIY